RHTQSEIFGNGLYTRRELDSETGLVKKITTGAVAGTKIRELNYLYDARGRITSKTDTNGSGNETVESFTYNDPQGRLSDWEFDQTVIGDGQTQNYYLSRAYQHDDSGNLTEKTGAGAMHYDPITNLLTSREVDGVTKNYSYDDNGNMRTGDDRTYQWTSFNKGESISVAGGSTVSFKYDASRQRKMKQTAKETRYYVNSGYERVERNVEGSIQTIHRYTIWNDGDVVASFEKTEESSSDAVENAGFADSVSYIHRDILGSGELVTDSRMKIVARRYYSPYGELVDELLTDQKQAYANVLDDGIIETSSADLGEAVWGEFDQEGSGDALVSRFKAGSSAKDLSGVRGFTSHESIEEVGLINMNARLYDPVIGRFVSADSIVPDPYTPLDYNRYAYVRGNPVVIRDPTGHNPLVLAGLFFAVAHYGDNPGWQMASSLILQLVLMDPTTGFFAGKGIQAGMVRAGASSLTVSFLKTGTIGKKSIESAGLAVLSAGVAHSIGHGWINGKLGANPGWGTITALHMVSQGVIADLRGDKFVHGAISALASQIGVEVTGGRSDFGSTAIVATLGGVASEATGGDFLNGALTAATVHLYNHREAKAAQKESWKPDWHKNRNDNQACPTTCAKLDQSQYWEEGQAKLHGGGQGYFTYRGDSDATQGYQCTYATQCTGISSVDQSIPLITDPAHAGTYDYIPPAKIGNTGIWNPATVTGHFFGDVVPYLIWGN
ncbi:MAG: RHS repeat-associated core domain-containing protein, partial [Pseudomonadales bacterium]|nr:RHS repeat-associated core domain-containing protein [Pseudomonadales bacterium]